MTFSGVHTVLIKTCFDFQLHCPYAPERLLLLIWVETGGHESVAMKISSDIVNNYVFIRRLMSNHRVIFFQVVVTTLEIKFLD